MVFSVILLARPSRQPSPMSRSSTIDLNYLPLLALRRWSYRRKGTVEVLQN